MVAMLRQFALLGPIVSGLFDSAVEAYAAQNSTAPEWLAAGSSASVTQDSRMRFSWCL